MLNAIHGVMLFCSYLYMESSSMLNAIQGGKLYAHCYTLIEALC